ncbi:MAG: DUF1616 domain-containing protein [Methanothrix sp.]|nr:DUF1616 domain-containing protein [Methanothrix sp.]
MRLAWPPPWHLIVSVLIPVIALALVHLTPPSQQDALSLPALIFVFLIPGYLATLSLFPGKSDLSGHRRAFLCLASSAMLAGLFSFILTVTPRGLQSASLATTLSLLAILLAAVAYGRWSNLPRKRRFLLLPKRGLGSTRAFPLTSIPSRHAVLAIILLAACFIAALAFAFGPYQFTSDEPFTKLEVTWPKEALGTPSSSLEEGKELFALAKIINHEKRQMNYTLKLIFRNSVLFSRDLILGGDESWQEQISFMLTGRAKSPGPEALDLLLYKEGELSSPYKEERLWVNLSQNNSTVFNITASNVTVSNATKNNSSVIIEDNSKVTVLSEGSGGMGGGSSSSSSQTVAKKPASQKALQPEKTASSPSTTATNTVGKVQSDTTVAGKNVSSPSLKSSKENLTDKDNLSINRAGTLAKIAPSPSITVAANETKAASSSAAPNVNDNVDNSTGNISDKTAKNKDGSSSESDLSRAISQSEIKLDESQWQGIAKSNRLPVLKALVPDRASPQQQGAAIFWKAEATDEEGDKILYRFFLDGQEVRKWSKINSWSWLSQDMPAGDYQITVLAIDSKHASLDSFDSIINASFTLIRPNQAPVLQELKPNSLSPQGRGSIITWTASAKDLDNDTIYYKFMKNDVDVTGWSASNSWIWDTSPETPGDYKISVLAKDGLHSSKNSFDSSMDSTFALTLPNGIPEVTELKADRTGPQAKGSVITWTAIVADPDGDAVSYKFLANDKEVREWSSSNSWIWDTSSARPGEYRIKVLARDGRHAPMDSFDSFKDAVITITIVDSNQPPVLKALLPDIASPAVQGATVIWKAEAQDPEGDKILYKFQLNGRDMGRWSESASWKWSTRDLAPGDYKIRVLARDDKHASEESFDSSMDAVFSLISEIDQQIDQLMKKRSADTSLQGNLSSADIQVASVNGTNTNAVLGKSSSTAGQEKAVTPRKLGG